MLDFLPTPRAPRAVLIALAGMTWTAVGVVLCTLALGWLGDVDSALGLGLGISGVVGAVIATGAGFWRIAAKNIRRLDTLPARPCVFAFQNREGWVTVVGMMCMGMAIRSLELPHHWLALVYETMGLTLLLSSGLFYARLWRGRDDGGEQS